MDLTLWSRTRTSDDKLNQVQVERTQPSLHIPLVIPPPWVLMRVFRENRSIRCGSDERSSNQIAIRTRNEETLIAKPPLAPNEVAVTSVRTTPSRTGVLETAALPTATKVPSSVRTYSTSTDGQVETERHGEIPVGRRTFCCPQCAKCFTSNSGLKQHMNIHASYKPFTCQVCQKSYTQFSNLCRHKRLHVRCRQRLACSNCGHEFANPFSLLRHHHYRRCKCGPIRPKDRFRVPVQMDSLTGTDGTQMLQSKAERIRSPMPRNLEAGKLTNTDLMQLNTLLETTNMHRGRRNNSENNVLANANTSQPFAQGSVASIAKTNSKKLPDLNATVPGYLREPTFTYPWQNLVKEAFQFFRLGLAGTAPARDTGTAELLKYRGDKSNEENAKNYSFVEAQKTTKDGVVCHESAGFLKEHMCFALTYLARSGEQHSTLTRIARSNVEQCTEAISDRNLESRTDAYKPLSQKFHSTTDDRSTEFPKPSLMKRARSHFRFAHATNRGNQSVPTTICTKPHNPDGLPMEFPPSSGVKTPEHHYVCLLCDKRFPRAANLNRHIRTHTGEQPYHCPHCQRSFSISSNMQRHVRNIHKPYTPRQK